MQARSALPQDYPHFVRLFAELGVDDPVPDWAAWEAMAPATFLMVRGLEVCGYGFYRILQGAGHVVHVVSDPAFRGQGVGRAIMAEMARRLRQAGCGEWFLNVRPDNAPALALYRRFGLARVHSSQSLSLQWADVDRLAWPAGDFRPLQGDEADEEVERTLGLPQGLLANLRQRQNVVLGLRGAQGVVALAGFNPAFPGANPFRTVEPHLARPLLELMRPHALPPLPHVRLMVENDSALARHMRQAGATVQMEVEHMRGIL